MLKNQDPKFNYYATGGSGRMRQGRLNRPAVANNGQHRCLEQLMTALATDEKLCPKLDHRKMAEAMRDV